MKSARKQILILGLLLSGLIIFLISCGINGNLFEPPKDLKADLDAVGLVEEGIVLFREGKYAEAYDYCTTAVDKDPTYSSAYYWAAKSYLRLYNLSIATIYNEIQDNTKIPFLGGGRSIESADSVYHPNWVALDLCRKIVKGPANDGIWNRRNLSLDISTMGAILGPFSIIDVDNDGHLERSHELERRMFERIQIDIRNVDTIKLNVDSIRDIIKNPDTVNIFIDELLGMIDTVSLENLSLFDESLDESRQSGLSAQRQSEIDSATKNYRELMNRLSYTAKLYRYDDLKDNDFDWFDTDKNGKVDTMYWKDYDGDSLIDIFVGTDSSLQEAGDVHILDAAYRLKSGVFDSHYTFTIKEFDPRDTIFIYKGPYRGEFIRGDYGVDEEIMDGKDNDRDGISDEDTRYLPKDDPTPHITTK